MRRVEGLTARFQLEGWGPPSRLVGTNCGFDPAVWVKPWELPSVGATRHGTNASRAGTAMVRPLSLPVRRDVKARLRSRLMSWGTC